MVKAVSNKRSRLSNDLGTIVSKLESSPQSSAQNGPRSLKAMTSDEIKNSLVLGFDGNQCQKGSQLHSNGFACGEYGFFFDHKNSSVH